MKALFTPAVQRYLLSSLVTFVSPFMLILITGLNGVIQNPQGAITQSALLGILAVAVRGGIKALVEHVVGGNADIPALGSSKQ